MMQTSDVGYALIREFEGCRLEAYHCPAGVCTIGYGHTGPDVRPGQRITKERAEELLRDDVWAAEMAVSELVHARLTQAQFDALVSFVFNIGRPAFSKSTALKKLNAWDFEGVPTQMLRWTKSGGRVLQGLVARRTKEAILFLGGDMSIGDDEIAGYDQRNLSDVRVIFPLTAIVKRLWAAFVNWRNRK